MDFRAQIDKLRADKNGLLTKLEALGPEGKVEEINVITGQMKDINSKMGALENAARESRTRAVSLDPEGAQDLGGGTPQAKKEGATPFNSLGEQLMAVRNAAKGVMDNRLLKVNDAAMGANESSGADGGFAIQEDFAGSILESAVQAGEILSRVDSYTVGASSNAARWLMIDETDVSASVFGGVQMYWSAEAAAVASSKPQFREMKLDLEKMMGFAYATDELLQDAPFMSGFFGSAFTLATTRLCEAGIISGDGNGKMLGVQKCKALVTVDKEAGQAAGTVTTQNILDMWQRAALRNRSNAVWLAHPDLETQFPKLRLEDKLLWMPEGGLSGGMYQTLLGRPILFTDECSAQGAAGDLMLADLSQYMLLRKGSAKQDWSMHVEFLSDQQCFRVVFRCNGAPKVDKPMKLKNSKNTRSPFVALGARA